jgi:hypothetical protein
MREDRQAAEANDAFDRAERDNEERKALWRLLAAYELNTDYGEFIAWMGLRDTPAAKDLYDLAHACWTVGWNRYGWDRLQQMCRIGWNGLYLNDRRLV